jgi:hypothetical protein
MAASLWRKKLVLHRSLVGDFIGISEIPIIHAPVPRSREISSALRGGDHSQEEQAAGEEANRSGTIRPAGQEVGGGRELKKKRKTSLDFLIEGLVFFYCL